MSLDDLCLQYLDACKHVKHFEELRESLRSELIYRITICGESTSAASVKIWERIRFFIPLEPLRSERPDIFTFYARSRTEEAIRVRHPVFSKGEEEVIEPESAPNE